MLMQEIANNKQLQQDKEQIKSPNRLIAVGAFAVPIEARQVGNQTQLAAPIF
jgi:hypothetical protein